MSMYVLYCIFYFVFLNKKNIAAFFMIDMEFVGSHVTINGIKDFVCCFYRLYFI